jgi:hypothetical protein
MKANKLPDEYNDKLESFRFYITQQDVDAIVGFIIAGIIFIPLIITLTLMGRK